MLTAAHLRHYDETAGW